MHLDHVRIDCRDQEAVRDFFVALLALKVGWRPPFRERGYWLYLPDDNSPPARNEDPDARYPDGARAAIHLWPRASGSEAGWVDHVCFRLDEDAAAIRARLERLGIAHRESRLPGTEVAQFFVTGPEGIKVEIQCPGR